VCGDGEVATRDVTRTPAGDVTFAGTLFWRSLRVIIAAFRKSSGRIARTANRRQRMSTLDSRVPVPSTVAAEVSLWEIGQRRSFKGYGIRVRFGTSASSRDASIE